MTAEVYYFGMIAEKLGKFSESIELMESDEPVNLRSLFEQLNPALSGMNYKIAVNQNITDIYKVEDTSVEIAFLPPFAGG